MDTIFAFISANAFLLGFVASITLSAVIALNGEKWINKLEEKYGFVSWIMEEDKPLWKK